ncbi:MAG: NADH-quinone oxidoreductase subunit NuoE [Proteobacteria bacterium]|nr:NADH-quinone oxidoreductase subunit NuoE [Pseudomonadota bacterium]
MSRSAAVNVKIDHDDKVYAWSDAAKAKIEAQIKKYPPERKASAVIPLLKLAQDEFDGWLPVGLMNLVADTLEMPKIRVYEVATFYDMFYTEPVGKHVVRVCTNVSCMIRGAEKVIEAVQKEVGLDKPGTSADGLITVESFECLGACCEAPMMMVGEHYHVNLTPERAVGIVKNIKAGKAPVEPSK